MSTDCKADANVAVIVAVSLARLDSVDGSGTALADVIAAASLTVVPPPDSVVN